MMFVVSAVLARLVSERGGQAPSVRKSIAPHEAEIGVL